MQCLESGEWSRSIPRCGMSALHVYSVNLYDTIIMSNHSQISIGSYLRSIRGQTHRRLHKQFLCLFLYYMYVIQEDSMLLCICSEKDHRLCPVVEGTSVTHCPKWLLTHFDVM